MGRGGGAGLLALVYETTSYNKESPEAHDLLAPLATQECYPPFSPLSLPHLSAALPTEGLLLGEAKATRLGWPAHQADGLMPIQDVGNRFVEPAIRPF